MGQSDYAQFQLDVNTSSKLITGSNHEAYPLFPNCFTELWYQQKHQKAFNPL